MFNYRFRITLLLALLVLTIGAGTARAGNSLAVTSSINISCNTASGPGQAQSITVKPATTLSGSGTIAVSVVQPGSGLVVTAPSTQTLSTTNQAAGIVYSVVAANGCVGVSTGTVKIQFQAGATNDASTNAAVTLTATASGLAPSPASVTLTCVKSGSAYQPGSSQTVNVTSTAVGGTGFTVDNSANPLPPWLTVSPLNGGTATGTAVPLSFSLVSSGQNECNALNAGQSTAFSVHLIDTPAPDKLVPVTLNVVGPSPLQQPATPAQLQYVKGSGQPAHDTVKFASTASPSPYFTVDTTTLPIWLTVDMVSGTATSGGATITFSTTSITDTLAVGTYNASVHIKVSGYGDLVVPFTLLINNPAPKFSVTTGLNPSTTWQLGSTLPTFSITVASSDTPIPYAITTGGALQPQISTNILSGLAYNFGTTIPVTFSGTVFASAQPGDSLTGTVTFTWGSNATVVVTLTVKVTGAGATISSLSPGTIPTASAGSHFSVMMSGSGFVVSTDPTQMTRVGVVPSGTTIVTDTNISYSVINQSSILLTFTVPASADSNLNFASGGSVTLGVCNPLGSSCSTATGTITLYIGAGPIIQAVTSASSFAEASPGSFPNVAPYDMLSIFGANFCVSSVSGSVTGCSSGQVLAGSPAAGSLQYPATLSPDPSGATQRSVQVTFYPHGQSGTPSSALGQGRLLFASNNQINVLAPGVLSTLSLPTTIDIVVGFGYGAANASTMLNSAPYQVNVVAADPGIFTIGSDGQGNGAILSSNWSLVTSSSPAGMRTTATDSDWVEIYLTGLGKPDSIASDTSSGSGSWSGGDCSSVSNFVGVMNGVTGGSLTYPDGVVLSDAWLATGRLVPCMAPGDVAVTIGGVPATVTYAGWVQDAIAGLYQINVQLPAAIVSAGQFSPAQATPLPLLVTMQSGAVSSQAGVNIWVAPRLKVAPPAITSGTVGISWTSGGLADSSYEVVATEGAGSTFHYAVTSGLLPSGLSLDPVSGKVSGTPGANTNGSYNLTVTATDNTPTIPVTGSVNFTIQIGQGLVVTNTTPVAGTYGTPGTLAQVSASGGVGPYTYTITSPGTLPTGLTIDASGNIKFTAQTPAGTYALTIGVTDYYGVTGSLSVTVAVNLSMSYVPITSSFSVGSGVPPITTVTTTGNSGTITYSLDSASRTAGFSINSSGQLTVSSGATPNTYGVQVTAADSTPATGATGNASSSVTVSVTLIL